MARLRYERDWIKRYHAAVQEEADDFDERFALGASSTSLARKTCDQEDTRLLIALCHVPVPSLLDTTSRKRPQSLVVDLEMELVESKRYRYITRPISYRVKRADVVEKFQGFSDHQCKKILRMTARSFLKLVNLVFHHAIFQNASYKEQEEVAIQVAVTLDRLGHNGNGMEATRLGIFWDRADGSCANYISRVVVALVSLRSRYLSWPTKEQRNTHSSKMALQGFPGCIGFVDGTTVPLSERPRHQGDHYYDRNGQYSLNVQVICNTDRKIIMLLTGYTG